MRISYKQCTICSNIEGNPTFQLRSCDKCRKNGMFDAEINVDLRWVSPSPLPSTSLLSLSLVLVLVLVSLFHPKMEHFEDPPSASLACENAKNFGDITRITATQDVFSKIDKKPLGSFSVGSSQELRALDMEKEMMDKSSPRGVLEDYIKDLESDFLRNIESETGSLNASTSETENQSNHSGTSHWRGFFNLWKTRSARRLASYPSVKASKCPSKSNRMCSAENMDICYLRSSWKNFKLSELQNATKNFSLENLIGKGGYAEVYKGCLKDGLTVAIKRLTRGTPEDMIGNFLSELGIMVHVNHPNIASLIGYGIEGGMHLVLQLSPNGSLDSLLHGMNRKLEWSIRFKIALGTAEGLLYLHDSCQRRIIHRDIKAANILLTENFEPQICDFGLAKWLPKDWTHHTVSKFEGTLGYLAPEYFMNGTVDEKTDIYAYGVLLLELITGLRPLDDSEKSLVMRAKHLLDLNDYKKLIDPSLCDAYDQEEMDRVALTANMCIQQSSILRPPMQQVVQMLRGDEESLARVRNYPKPFLRRTYSEELFDAEEYNSTRYLSDLQRHRQIAFDFR